MGALKLAYRTTKPTLKVVYSNLYESKKNCLSSSIYGFNGQEKDDEVKGQGNSYDFGARMLDVRLGRWLTIDQLARKYPNQSPYNFVVNSPLLFIDNDGESVRPTNSVAKKEFQSTIDNVFSKVGEVKSQIQFMVIGKDKAGKEIEGFAFNQEKENGNILTIDKARDIIKNSTELSIKEKLVALAFLDVIEQEDIIEIQTPRKITDEKFGILSSNKRLLEATNDFNNEATEEDNDGISDSNRKSALGGIAGEAEFKFFENEEIEATKLKSIKISNSSVQVLGIVNINDGLSSDKSIEAIKSAIIDVATDRATNSRVNSLKIKDKKNGVESKLTKSGEVETKTIPKSKSK